MTRGSRRTMRSSLPLVAPARTVLSEIITPTKSGEVLPLIPPSYQLADGGTLAAPHDLDLLRAAWPAIIQLINKQGHLVQIEGFNPPAGRIIDHDLALLVYVEHWLNMVSSDQSRRPIIDIRNLAQFVRVHPAKNNLMTFRGVPWGLVSKPHPMRAEWPEDTGNGLRWTTSRFRDLHKSGFVYMPLEFGDDGLRIYHSGLAKAGLARACWLASSALPHGVAPVIPEALHRFGLTLPTP